MPDYPKESLSDSDLQTYINWCKSQGLRETTIERYVYFLKFIPKSYFNDIEKVNNFIQHCGFTASELLVATAAVRSYYKNLGKYKLISEIQKPRYKLPQRKYSFEITDKQYSDEEIRILECCETLEEKVILKLIIETAMRGGMVVSLKKKDVDTKKNVIYGRREYFGNKKKEDVIFYITNALKNDLVKYMEINAKKDNDKIFTLVDEIQDKLKDYHRQEQALYRLVRRVGKRTGIDKCKILSPHRLRHVIGTKVGYKTNYNVALVRDFLKQSTSSSAEVYIHIPDTSKDTHEKIYGK